MEQVDRAVVLCCVPLFSWALLCQCDFSRGRCSCDVIFQCGGVDRAVVCAVCLCSVGLRFVNAVSASVGAVVMRFSRVEQWAGQWFCAVCLCSVGLCFVSTILAAVGAVLM